MDQRVYAVKCATGGNDCWLAVHLHPQDAVLLKDQGCEVVESQNPNLQPTHAGKHGFAFLAPVFAGLPGTAVIVGAATLGIVGGVAGTVGSKVGNWIWPDKKE